MVVVANMDYRRMMSSVEIPSERYGRWQVWRCPPDVQRHAPPVGVPVRGYDAAGRGQYAGRVRAEWPEIRIAMPSRAWHGDMYAPARRGERRPHGLPPDHACAGVGRSGEAAVKGF